MRNSVIFCGAFCGALLLAGAGARALDTVPGAHAELKDSGGKSVGTVELTDTPHGVLLAVSLTAAPAGDHALHVHETGKCEPPFKSAGSHFNPTSAVHGYLQDKGPHAGDLPNLHVPQDGKLNVELLAAGTTLGAGPNSLLDADASAIVMHTSRDDYSGQPAGNAGDPIICGVVVKAGGPTK